MKWMHSWGYRRRRNYEQILVKATADLGGVRYLEGFVLTGIWIVDSAEKTQYAWKIVFSIKKLYFLADILMIFPELGKIFTIFIDVGGQWGIYF